MAGEERGTRQDDVAVIKQEIKREIDTAKAAADAKKAQKELAERILKELKDAQDEARRYTKAEKKADYKEEASHARRTLIRATEVARANIDVVPNKPKSQKLLAELGERALDAESACQIQTWLGDYLLGNKDIVISKPGKTQSEFVQDFQRLKESDGQAADRVAEALGNNASVYGMDKNDIRPALEVAPDGSSELSRAEAGEMPSQLTEGGAFGSDLVNYYTRFTQEQQKFLQVLYTPQSFIAYVQEELNPTDATKKEKVQKQKAEIAHEIKELSPHISAAELKTKTEAIFRDEVSEGIIGRLGDVMAQLFSNLQIERPEKFFDEVAQDDYMRGIKTTVLQIKRAIATTRSQMIELEKASPAVAQITLKRHTEEDYFTEDKAIEVTLDDGTKITTNKPYARMKPIPVAVDVNLSGFLAHLESNLNHYYHRQGYLYNSRALFNHPAGEKGFYGQMGEFAESLSGTDLDEMMLLPDGQLVYEAFLLYDKFHDEEFAKMDWKHRTNQFTNKLEYINTQVESEVIDAMRKSNPNLSESKIRDALNIAIGMSRGVFMSEPEKSAFADPVDYEGKGLYASYSTNDATALTPLNPHHIMMRWQGQHQLPMYYFLPVGGDEKMNLASVWDHKKLWANGKKYMDSYKLGRQTLEGDLLIDHLVNINKAAGIMQRRGWRLDYGLRGFFEFKKDPETGQLGKMKVLESWKNIENIGFEAINFFLNPHGGPLSKDFLANKGSEKNQFFEYLYKKYFIEDESKFNPIVFNLYLDGIRREVRQDVRKNLGTRKAGGAPESVEKEIELQTSQKFLNQVLSREVAWRFPTKLLRMDRDRFNKDGISNWRRIYEKANKKYNMTRDEFDKVMKDLTFAETLLRKEISGIMRKKLSLNPGISMGDLSDPINYRLTATKIEELLKGKLTADEIGRAVNVYDLIKNTYLNNTEFLNAQVSKITTYKFNYGLEDTDFTFIAFRGAGPRTIARAAKDLGHFEKAVIPGIFKMPAMLNKIATDGKHDFSPILEYFQQVKQTYEDVHGPMSQSEFVYKMAASAISYFKKDSVAKPLFGLFRIGRRNSIAAEVAGRSTAVWEWDSRDIDRFCVALESTQLLTKEPFDLTGKPEYEPLWINLFGKIPIRTPFKRQKDFNSWNTRRLRKEFGASVQHMMLDIVDQFLPIVMAFILWKYLQDALKEVEGKKK